VAVFRALNLGDLLVAVPALRALRSTLPRSKVYLIGLPWAREFVGRFAHLLDGFREFPGWPGLPERAPQLARIPGFLARMQAEQFDLVLQMHGSGPFVNTLCALMAARYTAGFHQPGGYCPDPARFIPWPNHGLELRRLLTLTESLGCPTAGEHLEFPLREHDFAAAERLVPPRFAPYVCIHPGASVPERRWPADRFACVAKTLADRGLRIVLTGSAAEAQLTHSLASSIAAPVVDLAGKTSLATIAAVIARSRLLVCNDTGVSHVAAAVRTPSVVVSTGDNPARWSPTDADRHCVLCLPLGLVDPVDVLTHADALLSRFCSVSLPENAPCTPSVC
jgi:ADP-heptose:LPS heptosyltransferase